MYNVFVEGAHALVRIWGKRTILWELIFFCFHLYVGSEDETHIIRHVATWVNSFYHRPLLTGLGLIIYTHVIYKKNSLIQIYQEKYFPMHFMINILQSLLLILYTSDLESYCMGLWAKYWVLSSTCYTFTWKRYYSVAEYTYNCLQEK